MGETTKPIKICALMLYPHGIAPGQRFRIEEWELVLEPDGIKVDYYAFADHKLFGLLPQRGRFFAKSLGLLRGVLRRVRHLLVVRKYDVVLIYRAASIVGPAIFERLISVLGRPIVFDFDDAIFLTDTADANRSLGWAKFSGKTATICSLADVVTVGNSFLADYAQKFNKNVHIVPTSLDTEEHKPQDTIRPAGRPVVIGWTGSSTSQRHLEDFEPLLEKLLKLRDVEIRVLSDREPAFTTVPFTWRPWSKATEIEEISQFDIGIMPLPDDDWARGKCSFKALQCMSLGIPTICSAVGTNLEVIDHGVNGFLATSDEDWLECFTRLIDDPKMRLTFGLQAREKVVEEYSKERSARRFARAIKSIVNDNAK